MELQLGGKCVHPQELTQVSDWGARMQATTLQLQVRRVSVVRVLAALMLGQIAHAFQFRELLQQLFLDPFFQRYIDH